MSSVKSSRHPKYRELADILIKAIRANSLPVGEKLAGEHELVAKYGVSRYTVRSALRLLEDLGMVTRHRGKGTYLTSTQPFHMYQQTVRSIQDLTQLPENCTRQLIKKFVVQTDDRLASLLGCRFGTKWSVYSLIRMQSTGTQPLCWQDIYVRPSLESSCKWILNKSGVGTAKDYDRLGSHAHKTTIDVGATHIPKHMADSLQASANGPALMITRRYVDTDNAPYCISVLHFPAGRFTYSFEMTRERAEFSPSSTENGP